MRADAVQNDLAPIQHDPKAGGQSLGGGAIQLWLGREADALVHFGEGESGLARVAEGTKGTCAACPGEYRGPDATQVLDLEINGTVHKEDNP